jgi:hypothetical protein
VVIAYTAFFVDCLHILIKETFKKVINRRLEAIYHLSGEKSVSGIENMDKDQCAAVLLPNSDVESRLMTLSKIQGRK